MFPLRRASAFLIAVFFLQSLLVEGGAVCEDGAMVEAGSATPHVHTTHGEHRSKQLTVANASSGLHVNTAVVARHTGA
jgi:hypothetical protein